MWRHPSAETGLGACEFGPQRATEPKMPVSRKQKYSEALLERWSRMRTTEPSGVRTLQRVFYLPRKGLIKDDQR